MIGNGGFYTNYHAPSSLHRKCSRSSAHNEFIIIMPAFCARCAIAMACSSSSFLVSTAAINATLEDPSFRTGSKVAADALKSAQTLKTLERE